jgi:hypothetical protein
MNFRSLFLYRCVELHITLVAVAPEMKLVFLHLVFWTSRPKALRSRLLTEQAIFIKNFVSVIVLELSQNGPTTGG